MTNHVADALDGSVQEIAINHENPISTDPSTLTPAGQDTATHPKPAEATVVPPVSQPDGQPDQWEKVDEDEAPFSKRGPGRPRKIITAEAAADKIVKLPLDRLLSHPLNEKLYGPTSPKEINDLADSIKEVGQQVPLVVTANLEKIGFYTLLSGHKRAAAMGTLGRTEANCQVVDVPDADERLIRLLEANRQHVPTMEQKIRIGDVYLGLETRKAKARKVAGAKAAKEGGKDVETLTQAEVPAKKVGNDDEAGKARDLAAKNVGMSGVSFERGLKTLRASEQAALDGKKETAAELLRILNEKGVEPAFSQAKSLHLIEQITKKKSTGGAPQAVTVPTSDADTPHLPAQGSNTSKPDEVVAPSVLLLAGAGAAETVPKSAEDSSPLAGRTVSTVDTLEADDPPPVVSIITACNKLVDDLEELDPADLSTDQKWNLSLAFDALSEWFANHDEMLNLPGQI